MSIINQMLRDLDARGASSNEQPATAHDALPERNGPSTRMVATLLVLALAGGLAGYILLSDTPDKESSPVVVAAVQPRVTSPGLVADPKPLPVLPVPPVPVEEHDKPSAPLVEPVANPVPVPAELKPLEVPAVQVARPPVESKQSTIQAIRSAPVPAPASVIAEPSVVKKMAELTPEMEARQLHDDAQALRRAGKIEAAMSNYRLALERQPGMRSARIQLARLMQDSGQPDAAFSLLKAGYDQKPDDGLAIAAGRLLADQGRREEALNWLERGRDGLRPADHALMGALQSQTLRYEAAVKSYQRALAADPNQGGWLLGLGLAQEAMGRIEDAHVTYRNALDRGEFKPDVVNFLRQKLGMPSL
jgi:MSHA biogenesis protein MshN